MAGKLDAKVAIITGASSGIGAATAIALAEEGAQVAIAARRIERLNEVVQKIEAIGGKALPIVTDVSDETQVNNLVQKVNTTLGRIDILVNNAGIVELGTIEDGDPAEWRRQLDLNVLGLLYAIHAILPIFKAQGVGHVVNLSSLAGRTARAGMGCVQRHQMGRECDFRSSAAGSSSTQYSCHHYRTRSGCHRIYRRHHQYRCKTGDERPF
jgi:NADP-dependent 3-hydroxy acid dehydrogenase YdfG